MSYSPISPFAFHLHPRQLEVFQCPARFRVLVAGRRFGKTHLAIVEMLVAAQRPGSIVWYVGPNDRQSKRIVWDRLKELSKPFWSKTPNETERRIDLTFGSSIFVNGAFNPASLRGVGIDFLVIDEFASIKPEVWQEVFRPALADRKGRALFIGTPQGCNHFFDLYEQARTSPDWAAFQFTTEDGGLVAKEELLAVAREMDNETYRQEMLAEFRNTTRYRVYHGFNKAVNVAPLTFDRTLPLVWSLDFNIDPFCMLIMQKVGEMVYVLEEIVLRPNANTETATQQFLERAQDYYARTATSNRPFVIKVYGDSAGSQRHTAGTHTDWAIVRQAFDSWRGVFQPEFYTATANPRVKDRLACVNARLRNQLEETRLMIDPKCVELIRDLEEVSWAVDSTGAPTNELNKSDKNRTHLSDALGYFVSQVFPMKPQIGPRSDGRII